MSALTVVFDLDGTLVDTAADLASATNRILASEGLAPISLAKMRTLISYGARHMIERGLSERGAKKPQAEVDALLATFLADYGKTSPWKAGLFPALSRCLGA